MSPRFLFLPNKFKKQTIYIIGRLEERDDPKLAYRLPVPMSNRLSVWESFPSYTFLNELSEEFEDK